MNGNFPFIIMFNGVERMCNMFVPGITYDVASVNGHFLSGPSFFSVCRA